MNTSQHTSESFFPPLTQALHHTTRLLHKKQEREEQQVFLIEGEKLCREALLSHATMRYAIITGDPSTSVQVLAHDMSRMGVDVFQTQARKFEQLCDAATPQGVVAVVKFPEMTLNNAQPLVVLDGVADPGNVGTIIRTADWFGVRQILLGAGCADRFNPKTLRSTMGSIFRCTVATTDDLATTLQRGFPQHTFYGATLDGARNLDALRMGGLYGLVLGSESHGISLPVRRILTDTIKISGSEGAESLNVAVAAGILLHYCFTYR